MATTGKHPHPQHASLHKRWLHEQMRLAKKKAGNRNASDAEHKAALERLTHLHGQLVLVHEHLRGHAKKKTTKKTTKKK